MCAVARQAEAILTETNPAALSKAIAVLAYLKNSHPSITTSEGSHPFTECATFADDVKSTYSYQADWHFVDQPFYEQGGSAADYPGFVMSDTDVVAALTDLTAFLKGETVSASSPYISQIQSSFSNKNDQLSFALRLTIHYMGDIHQPLHTVSGVDDEYPKGDRGGNSEWIPSVDGVGNLHSLWDSVIYQYPGYPSLVSAISWALL